MNEDLYQILGILKTATPVEIKKAYRKRSQQCHPDKTNGDESEFERVKLAYDILSNPEKRAHYDATGNYQEQQATNENKEVNQILAQGFAQILQTQPMNAFAEIDLIELLKQLLQGYINKIEDALNKIKSEIEAFEIVAKRLQRQKGRGVLNGLVTQRIEALTKNLNNHEQILAFHKQALELAGEYNYQTDPQSVQFFVLGGGATTSTTNYY